VIVEFTSAFEYQQTGTSIAQHWAKGDRTINLTNAKQDASLLWWRGIRTVT